MEITKENAETDERVEIARKPEVAVATHWYQQKTTRQILRGGECSIYGTIICMLRMGHLEYLHVIV